MESNQDPIIQIHLSRLVKLILRDDSDLYIEEDIARAIHSICQNKMLCHIQFPGDVQSDGQKIKFSKIWDINWWRKSVDRERNIRIESEKDRVRRQIFDANMVIVARAIRVFSGVEGDSARAIAHRCLLRNNKAQLAAIGVTKLIEREEEL